MTEAEQFLANADEVALQIAGMTEEDVVALLPILRDRLIAVLAADKGPIAAAEIADRLVATIFRRRQEILAPVVH